MLPLLKYLLCDILNWNAIYFIHILCSRTEPGYHIIRFRETDTSYQPVFSVEETSCTTYQDTLPLHQDRPGYGDMDSETCKSFSEATYIGWTDKD